MTRFSAFLVLSAVALVSSPTIASTITWGPATDTTSASDVSTTGSLVKAFDSGGLGTTVNGVTFAPAGNGGDDVYAAIGLGTFGQFDDLADLGNLDALLRTGNYTAPPQNTPPTIMSLSGLVSGTQYQLQIFFMDQRGSPFSPPAGCVGCNDRQVTFTSASNSVTLEADPGNTSSAPFGQYVVGAFTADSSTQAFGVTGAGFDQFGTPVSLRQVNAWQLRAVPEPASVTLLAFGVSLLALLRRKLRP